MASDLSLVARNQAGAHRTTANTMRGDPPVVAMSHAASTAARSTGAAIAQCSPAAVVSTILLANAQGSHEDFSLLNGWEVTVHQPISLDKGRSHVQMFFGVSLVALDFVKHDDSSSSGSLRQS